MRVEGLEPTCLAASDPKSDTSANFATPAFKLKAYALGRRENKDFYAIACTCPEHIRLFALSDLAMKCSL